ncbi:MAG: Na+/H+ antiporter NhaC family protein [Cryomorphaceae bacterium]|nr:MAG: Na+/H+ antiporter NhaC family protein [Cryomorphaceae bacterium]
MRTSFLLLFLLTAFGAAGAQSEPGPEDYRVELSAFSVKGIPTTGTISLLNDSLMNNWGQGAVPAVVNGERRYIDFQGGEGSFTVSFDRNEPFSIRVGQFAHVQDMTPMPLWLSVLPPLIAIALALVFKEVIASLFLGLLFGAGCVGYYSTGWSGAAGGFFRVIDTYIISALNDWGHLAVILFSLFIGAIVAIVTKNGGMLGVVNRISRLAKTPRSGQLTTWGMGLAIFFDDYANTLVVGNTLRPVTDRLRISREKLSYIVDSTAAPMAAIALVTTWIGAQLGYIDDGLKIINADETVIASGSYAVMVQSLAYSYYPILTLVFIFMLVWMGRDYGPMYRAEVAARKRPEGQADKNYQQSKELEALQPEDGINLRPLNAIIPIAVVIFGTVAGLLITGWDSATWAQSDTGFFRKLALNIGDSDSYTSLLWSSLAGLATAILLTVTQGIMPLGDTLEAMFTGFKTMLGAIAILVLAWSLAAITEQMHSADYLTGILTGNIPYWLLPGLTFLLAALVAFSTGSSWGTMAILYPLMLPLSWSVCMAAGCDMAVGQSIFFHVVSAVLAGSVLGDHCSPISDTTILSSMAASVNHIAHVQTQLPYALTVGAVAFVLSVAAALLQVNGLVFIAPGVLVLWLVIRVVGKEVEGRGR